MRKILTQAMSYYWTNKIQYNKPLIIVSVILEVLSKTGYLCLPIVLKYAIDGLTDNIKIYSDTTLHFIVGYGVLWMFNPLVKNLQVICKNIVTENSIVLFTHDIFERCLNLPLKFHFDKKTGKILNSLILLRYYFTIFCDAILWMFIPLLLEATVAISFISYFYGAQYATLLFMILAIYIIINISVAKILMKAQSDVQKSQENLSSYTADMLMNFEAIKIFGNENYILNKYHNLLNVQKNFGKKASFTMMLLAIVQNIIIGIGLTSILFLAFTQIQGKILVLSDFVLLNSYVLQFSLPMSYFTYLLRDSKQSYIILKEGFKIFEEPTENFDLPNLANESTSLDVQHSSDLSHSVNVTNSIDFTQCKNIGIKFENINFSYNEAHPILKDISFEVQPGQKLAIVGATGAGKSTISKLLFRYFEANSGNILVNNHHIKRINLKFLRSCISIIPQDTILFNESLYDNIIFGNPKASKQEVLAAIKIACLDKLIDSLPEGYDTIVGERGIKLSGGERQRIAIARAIIKNPKIFIFDEATSSLDSNTEKEIQKNLDQISTGVTTIIIAHRLSTIKNANKILVLEDGKIIESGTHESLITEQGRYYHLWNLQLNANDAMELKLVNEDSKEMNEVFV